MRPDLLDPNRSDPVDGGSEPDRLSDLRGSRLELPREVGPRRLVGGDGADHVPTADERRHLLEQRAPSMQHADPRRPVGLVASPGVEVDIELGELDRKLRDRLRPVDEHDRAGVVRAPRDRRHRVDRAEHVRDVDERDELRPAREQRVQGVEVELAVFQHGDVGELGLAVLAEKLPGHDVGVMLHLGQHDEVAAVDVLPPPRVGDQVDRGRRVRGEDRLLRGRAEPLGDPLPRPFVEVGRLDGQGVDAAMDRGPRMRVVAGHRVDHGLRGLGRGRRVEIRERVTCFGPVAQDREVGCDRGKRDAGRAHAHQAGAFSISSVIHP